MSNTHMIVLFVAGTLLLAMFALFLVVFFVIQRQKQNAYLLEKQKTHFDHQNDILKTRIEVQESAMREISKEVHDNIKSKLAGVQVSLKRMISTGKDAQEKQLLHHMVELVGQTISDASKISHSLNTEFIKQKGLAWLLKNELEYIGISQQIDCRFEQMGDAVELPAEKGLQVYRIAQEAIQNILKHAKASAIEIRLDNRVADKLNMTITDNGVGFDSDKILSFGNGEGLVNMRQRAEILDAELEIQSAPAAGCSVSLTLNINNGSESAYQDSHS